VERNSTKLSRTKAAARAKLVTKTSKHEKLTCWFCEAKGRHQPKCTDHHDERDGPAPQTITQLKRHTPTTHNPVKLQAVKLAAQIQKLKTQRRHLCNLIHFQEEANPKATEEIKARPQVGPTEVTACKKTTRKTRRSAYKKKKPLQPKSEDHGEGLAPHLPQENSWTEEDVNNSQTQPDDSPEETSQEDYKTNDTTDTDTTE
jgi:hypothetical protein